MKNWELCPKCSGRGQVSDVVGSTYTCAPCDLCNGHKVIGSFTGKPPKGDAYKVTLSNFGLVNGELTKIH